MCMRSLVLTPELYRDDYLDRYVSTGFPSYPSSTLISLIRLMKIPPVERLEYLRRPVPGYLEKLRLPGILYDHLYEKIEREARAKAEQTFLERVQTKLESHLARSRTVSGQEEIGRAF